MENIEKKSLHYEVMPYVSVIIPCYNAEKTIWETLKSLEMQTYKYFEVIIVNDGSSDNTLDVVKKFQKITSLDMDIISQKNRGVSVARNVGILNARADFITFLDSDDRYQSSFLDVLITSILEYDVDFAFSKYSFVNEGENWKVNYQFPAKKQMTKYEILKTYFHKRTELISFACGIYRTEIIRKYEIRFPVGVKYGEDSQFFCEYIYYCNRGGVHIENMLYEYWLRKESVTKNANYEMVQNIEVFIKISNLWGNDVNFKNDNLGQYAVSRAIWSVAKTFALLSDKSDFFRLQNNYDITSAMKYMCKHGDEKTIRITSGAYCINARLFILLVGLYKILQMKK